MPEIVAAENPALANQLIEKMLSEDTAEVAPSVPQTGKAFTDLPDTHVTLPGGYLTSDGDLVREAEVRELTGFDEEALAKASSPAKVMYTLLQRGVVSVGGQKPDQSVLNDLLAADRDTLLLAIRKATYGADVELTGLTCPHCQEVVDIVIDLNADVEMKVLENPEDRQFIVDLSRGEALVNLPDGNVQRAVLLAEDKTIAELSTILLRHCVVEIDGFPVISEDSVRRLSVRDREKINDAIAERNPGPQLSAVKKACPSCEEVIELPLSLAGLFRF